MGTSIQRERSWKRPMNEVARKVCVCSYDASFEFQQREWWLYLLDDILRKDKRNRRQHIYNMIGEGCFDNLYTGYEAIVFMNNIEDSIIQKLENFV